MVEFDVETTGFQPYSGHKAFLYVFHDGETTEALTDDKREEIQAWFDRAAVDPEGVRAWNSKFDRSFAEAAGFTVPPDGKWHDGMLVAQAMDERRSVALKAVAVQLFGEDSDELQKQVKDWLNKENARRRKEAKDNGTEFEPCNYSDVPMDLMEPYAKEDVILTRKIGNVYDPKIEALPDLKRCYEFERKAMDALYAVEKRGLPASAEDYRMLELEAIENLERLEDRCVKLAGDPEFNTQSSREVLEALKRRGADMSYMETKEGKIVSADADNLRAVDDELAQAVLDFRAEAKVLSTYVRPMLGRHYVSAVNSFKEGFIAPDGRIHATYRQVGARTGRMSCADPNMQNQPRDDLRLRYCIRAEPGMKLIACDLSNIEMVLFAAYAGEGRLLETLRAGGDLHTLTAQMIGFRDRARPGGVFESARQQGKVYNFCVPMDTEILTKRGWLSHNEVREGDYTIGYNAKTRKSEWTRINGVHKFGESPLVKMSSGSWSAVCTPNHRWVTEKMRKPEIQALTPADELTSEHRLILSAPLESDSSYDIPRLNGMKRDGNWTERVLSMSSEQRRAWLAGFALGEGCCVSGDTWQVFQNQGDLADAAELAIYLEGYRATGGIHHFKGGNVPHQRIRAARPNITGQRLVQSPVESAPVWCVTTDLETWTMRQPGGQIMLTGNTRIYGGGIRSIRKYFRVDTNTARLYKRRYDDAYPEVVRLNARIEAALYQRGYVQDSIISGRRFRCDPRKEAYKATNYLVQGTAAALLKEALIKLHSDGVPVVALVHDEVVAHVEEKDAREVKELIIKRLTENEAINEIVPIRAEGDIIDHWSDAKPNKDGSLFVPNWRKEA